MKKYVILLESNADIEYIKKRLNQLNSTRILGQFSNIMKIETEVGIGYIESIAGIKIVEEEILHYKS